jgi:hypothetical protein
MTEWLLKRAIIIFAAIGLVGCGNVNTPIQPVEGESSNMLETSAAYTQTSEPELTTATPIVLSTWTPVPTAETGVVVIDAAQELGPISPYISGVNHGPWATVPFDLSIYALDAGITFIRFPGGNYGDDHNLRELQIDQFIQMTRQYGAEPHMSVRLQDGTVEAAAAMVEYTNVEKDYAVRYWSIGNEPNLFGEEYDTAQFNSDWRAYAEAMLAVDPDIILVGPDINTYVADGAANPKDASGKDWMEEFLKANGDLVDIVSIHRYPFPRTMNTAPPAPAELLDSAREFDTTIPFLRQTIRDITGRDIPVAVTEVNSNWSHTAGAETTPDSYLNAVWWADAMGRLIRQQVDIIAFFSLQSSPQLGAYGMLASTELRPVYHVYPIYKMFGRTLLQASSGVENVSVYASRRDDGAITVVMINMNEGEQSVPVRFDGLTQAELNAEVWRLDSTMEYKQVDSLSITDAQEVSLPGYSVSLLIIE